jgi:2,4-dienoyl-CoA reductase-like NADH-dependent reductase (Old Yellow Enzyme family)/thioredoxin reductase
MALTHVNTPCRLGPVEVKNRIFRSAHVTGFAVGQASEDFIAYHAARARGGVGLSILEALSVHPTSPVYMNAWGPDMGDSYKRLVDACSAHGMKLFQQIWHGGHNMVPADGSPPWSASDVPGPQTGVAPIPMTKAMINTVIEAFAETAAKCERWGLDGIEMHAAHGYLPAQFFSPNANKREDEYGGSFENRARFIIETATAIKAATSRKFAVGVRVADDLTEGGVNASDYLRLCQMLEARELIDFVDISLGNYQKFHKIFEGMQEPVGYELPTSRVISRPMKIPTMVIGRFRTLEEADQVIRQGDADMVGMTRAHIADPDIVSKTLAGRAEEVRPCIGCNQGCLGGLFSVAQRMGCAVNAAVGFEQTIGDDRLRKVDQARKVLVVGGGPAGMEAARVAALRGHRVVLCEAAPDLGGTVKVASKAPTRAGLADITVWLEQEVYRLGVDVRLNTYVDVDDIRTESPDAVIVATGSLPRMDGIQLSNPGEPIAGMDLPHVISSIDLFLDGQRKLGRSALVVDDVGHYEAIAAAEYLIARGLSVTFVSRHLAFAPAVEWAMMTEPALERLGRGDFRLLLRTRAIEIRANTAVVGPTYLPRDSNRTETLAADTVVFVSLNRPNRDLAATLSAAGTAFRVVGDANSPRFLQAAIREGHLAGAAI